MNHDNAFLSSLIHADTQTVLNAKAQGIVPDFLETKEARDALTFIYEYVSKYGGVPPPDIVLVKTGLDLKDAPGGTAEFFINEIIDRRLFQSLQQGVGELSSWIQQRKPREGLESLQALVRRTNREGLGRGPVSLFGHGPSLLAHYDEIKSGKRGILTRWPSVNDATLGFWPQELVLFVARLGVGKTWAAVITAHDAWAGRWAEFDGMNLKVHQSDAAKKKVLMVSTEMTQARIGDRFYAVRYNLPYKQFRAGKLQKVAEDRFRAGVLELQDMPGMFVVGGNFDFTFGALEAAIEACEPDLLVLDGAYLLRNEGRNRTEQAANTFDEIKRVLHRYKIPGVLTSQLNRQANQSQKNTISSENIALTDVAGWNSDLVIAMIQDDASRKNKRMLLKPLKVREGEGREIELRWDFDVMNFDELPGQAQGVSPVGSGTGDAAGDSAASEDNLPF